MTSEQSIALAMIVRLVHGDGLILIVNVRYAVPWVFWVREIGSFLFTFAVLVYLCGSLCQRCPFLPLVVLFPRFLRFEHCVQGVPFVQDYLLPSVCLNLPLVVCFCPWEFFFHAYCALECAGCSFCLR